VQRVLIAVVLAAVLIVVVVYLRPSQPDAPARPAEPSAKTAAPAPAAAPAPPAHATRITPDARRQIAERIATAQAARAARAAQGPAATGAAPRTGTDTPPTEGETVETMKTPILGALKETIPFLQECFAKLPEPRPRFQFRGNLTLTGDADIGTLVDADRLTDDRERPLPAELDDCLRGTLQTIQLPPLREGDKMTVTYVFSDDEK